MTPMSASTIYSSLSGREAQLADKKRLDEAWYSKLTRGRSAPPTNVTAVCRLQSWSDTEKMFEPILRYFVYVSRGQWSHSSEPASAQCQAPPASKVVYGGCAQQRERSCRSSIRYRQHACGATLIRGQSHTNDV